MFDLKLMWTGFTPLC